MRAQDTLIPLRDRTIGDQLTQYLTDVHSSLEQMKVAPRWPPAAASEWPSTRTATSAGARENGARGARRRGADSSTLKDLAGRVGGWAVVVFARLNPDMPGKLVIHAFSYPLV